MFNKYKTGREEESWGGPSHSGDNSSFPQEFSLTAAAAAAATVHGEQGPGPTVCSVLHWFCAGVGSVLHWCWLQVVQMVEQQSAALSPFHQLALP